MSIFNKVIKQYYSRILVIKKLSYICKLFLILLLATGCEQPRIKPSSKAVNSSASAHNTQETYKEIIANLKTYYPNIKLDSNLASAWGKSLLKNIDKNRIFITQNRIDSSEFYFGKSIFYEKNKITSLFKVFSLAHRAIDEISSQFPVWVSDIDPSSTFIENSSYEEWPESMPELKLRWESTIANELFALTNQKMEINAARKRLIKKYQSFFENEKNNLIKHQHEYLFNALLKNIDPLTAYYPPLNNNIEKLKEAFGLVGVGVVLVEQKGSVVVVQPIDGGPADKSAKVIAGDVVIGVKQGGSEFVDTRGLPLDKVITLIRGVAGTKVTLNLLRGDDTETVTLTRKKVAISPSEVTSRLEKVERNGRKINIGIISIPSFYIDFQAYIKGNKNHRSATKDVMSNINYLRNKNVAGIIIDLRNNIGGALQEGASVSDIFLPKGKILQLVNSKTNKVAYLDSKHSASYVGPLVIMVNRKSAGSAEVFTAAIQDYNRGIIVGDYTFGMGNVYTLTSLSNGGNLKHIESSMYRTSGFSFHPHGIEPDILLNTEKERAKENNLHLPTQQINTNISAIETPILKPTYNKVKIVKNHTLRYKNLLKKVSQYDSATNESIEVLLDMIDYQK